MKGKEYARFILLNFEDNQHLFNGKKAAKEFKELMQFENGNPPTNLNLTSSDDQMNIESPDSFYIKQKKSDSKRQDQEEEAWVSRSTVGNCMAFIR